MPVILILLLVALALAVASGLAVHLAQMAQVQMAQEPQAAPPVTTSQAVPVARERTLWMDDFQRAMLTQRNA